MANDTTVQPPRRIRAAAGALAAVLLLGSTGCANLTTAQNDTLGGAGIGAAGGALIGALAGNPGLGALIGAGVGAGGGYLYGKGQENQRTAYREGYAQGRASR